MEIINFFKGSYLAGILGIGVLFSGIFLVLSIKRANKEYLECICGNQPNLMSCSDPYEKDILYRYECVCGREGPISRDPEKAKNLWAKMILKEENKQIVKVIEIKEKNK